MSDNFDAARVAVTWAGRTPAGGGRAGFWGPVPADYLGRPANWWITALSVTHRRAVTGDRLPAARTMHHAHLPHPGSAARQCDFKERGGLGGIGLAGRPAHHSDRLPADPEKA
jgi:hypothetical protein